MREEVRCGHLVTKEVKELWAVELDLLDQFKRICDKYGLRYFAAGGTLLGAARHQGFIPWDDDIDLEMLPEDYEKLCEVAPKELKEPYFFQYYGTEEGAPITHSRIRRSDTTGCTGFEYEFCRGTYNRGVFADIFPLYNIPDSGLKRLVQKAGILAVRSVLTGEEYSRKRKMGRRIGVRYMPFIALWKFVGLFTDGTKLRKSYMRICGWEKKRTQYVGMLSFDCRNKRLTWKRSLFDKEAELPFENTTVSCPGEWEAHLTAQYGDWKTPVKNAACHEMAVFDAKVPFSEKLK